MQLGPLLTFKVPGINHQTQRSYHALIKKSAETLYIVLEFYPSLFGFEKKDSVFKSQSGHPHGNFPAYIPSPRTINILIFYM